MLHPLPDHERGAECYVSTDLQMDTEYYSVSDRHSCCNACCTRERLREVYPFLFRIDPHSSAGYSTSKSDRNERTLYKSNEYELEKQEIEKVEELYTDSAFSDYLQTEENAEEGDGQDGNSRIEVGEIEIGQQ